MKAMDIKHPKMGPEYDYYRSEEGHFPARFGFFLAPEEDYSVRILVRFKKKSSFKVKRKQQATPYIYFQH